MQKILIITVGNRQIGWQCQDGQIRCLGAAPNSEASQYLYAEIAATPLDNSKLSRVRHLGELFYQRCQTAQDFSAVQLLLDRQIIESLVTRDLNTIWLIASDQPIEVSNSHRSGDTVWLAELMAGKIQQTWPNLQVKTHFITTNLGDSEALRDYYADLLLQVFGNRDSATDRPTIWVQTKGSTPAMSSGLDICAAALARDANVLRMIPQEPTDAVATGIAEFSPQFECKPLSQYFWPLEKPKIISAWERGEFGAAHVWLESQTSSPHAVLGNLAGYLERSTHQNLAEVLKDMKGNLLDRKPLKKSVDPVTLVQWKAAPIFGKQVSIAMLAWESAFQIPIHARSERWTDGLFLMAQTLERLLYFLSKKDKWLDQKWIEIPEKYQNRAYDPRLEELIKVWTEQYDHSEDFPGLDQIRQWRNKIVHEALTIKAEDIEKLWSSMGWPIAPSDQMLIAPLKPIAQELNLPDRPLLSLLYDWGLDQLRA